MNVQWQVRPRKSLAALLADKRGRAERFVELRLGEDAVATDAASKPRGERLLVGEAAGVHRPKFWRKQFRVTAADAEHDQRAGVADHGGPHRVGQLIGVLVRERRNGVRIFAPPKARMRMHPS